WICPQEAWPVASRLSRTSKQRELPAERSNMRYHSIPPTTSSFFKSTSFLWRGSLPIVLALISFALPPGLQGADRSDTFYGYPALNQGSGVYDSAFRDL